MPRKSKMEIKAELRLRSLGEQRKQLVEKRDYFNSQIEALEREIKMICDLMNCEQEAIPEEEKDG